MSDASSSSIGPVQPLSGARPVQAVRTQPEPPTRTDHGLGIGAVTGGSLPPAYSHFVVDSESHNVVLQVKDATTNEIISQYPSREVESMAAFMSQYVATLARHRAAQQARGITRA